jgi:hypothetical protein
MNAIRTPALVLAVLYLCFFGYLTMSGPRLPARVATHFDAGGHPNGWMSRNDDLLFMGVFGLCFPMLVPAVSYLSRFLPDGLHNIPRQDYWFAPERRAQTMAYLFRQSLWFASMALCFVIGIQASVIRANTAAQAHLSGEFIVALAVGFIIGTALWVKAIFRHFNEVG